MYQRPPHSAIFTPLACGCGINFIQDNDCSKTTLSITQNLQASLTHCSWERREVCNGPTQWSESSKLIENKNTRVADGYVREFRFCKLALLWLLTRIRKYYGEGMFPQFESQSLETCIGEPIAVRCCHTPKRRYSRISAKTSLRRRCLSRFQSTPCYMMTLGSTTLVCREIKLHVAFGPD